MKRTTSFQAFTLKRGPGILPRVPFQCPQCTALEVVQVTRGVYKESPRYVGRWLEVKGRKYTLPCILCGEHGELPVDVLQIGWVETSSLECTAISTSPNDPEYADTRAFRPFYVGTRAL
jgi:transcription elongation factor Elf1